MLNEIYDLAGSLKLAGVATQSWHRQFKPNPNPSRQRPAFCVLLDKHGEVTSIEASFDRDKVPAIRKWETENGVSFPAFNVSPLWKISSSERKAVSELKKELLATPPPAPEDRQQRLDSYVNTARTLWDGSESKRITKCLQANSQRLAKILGPPPKEFRAISDLIERACTLDAETFMKSLSDHLVAHLAHDPGNARDFFDLLFYYPEKDKKSPPKFTVILELADQSRFDFPANHAKVQGWMNERLLSFETTAAPSSGKDAYGAPLSGWEDTYPACRLPILGNVILRAMSSESPCQKRYHVIDARSYPVGREARRSFKASLEWLSAPERKGRTWCDVSSGNGAPSVLFAYPSTLPEEPPWLAGLFADAGSSLDPDGSRFSACAERVTVALKGIARQYTGTEIKVFVLGKADKARTKVICHAQYLPERLVEGAKEWRQGCENIPQIRIRRFGMGAAMSLVWDVPTVPFPVEAIWCLNTIWERRGQHAEQVRRFSVADGLTLLLGTGAPLQETAHRALDALTRDAAPLLLAMGHAHHHTRVCEVPRRYDKQVTILPNLLGLLLYKLEASKGGYMHQSHFLVGRLMSLADQLHELYCRKVRKGSVPPQLVGNALMPAALEQPVQALAILSQRILPYQAWARCVQGEDARRARFFLGEIGRLSQELAALELPESCDHKGKAAMLLGYLAWSGKSDAEGAESQSNAA